MTLPFYADQSRTPCCGWDNDPSWSPDGRRIVFQREWTTAGDSGVIDLYTVDVRTRRLERLTRTPDVGELFPAWSPDGRRIAFTSGALMTASGRLILRPVDSRSCLIPPTASESRCESRIPRLVTGWKEDRLFDQRWWWRCDRSDEERRIRRTTDHQVANREPRVAFLVAGRLTHRLHPVRYGEGADRQPGWLMVARADGTRSFKLVRDGVSPDWQPASQ